MDKQLSLQLNNNRKVTGILRGYDPFMNLVLDEAMEEVSSTEKNPIGMVVRKKRTHEPVVNKKLTLHVWI
jgi:small nuclear ribonucleoprotein G